MAEYFQPASDALFTTYCDLYAQLFPTGISPLLWKNYPHNRWISPFQGDFDPGFVENPVYIVESFIP